MSTYYGRLGARYTIDKQLGAGGEGTVYSLVGYDGTVAKIYKASKFANSAQRDLTERKLKAMLSMNVSYIVDGIARFAWPQDILYENDVMVGFTMPEIRTKYKIYDIYRSGRREKIYPDYTWKYSVQFAYHLAWLVDYLHSYNIVIGDFNQNNIAIDIQRGVVIIIDCDSFDIVDPITKEHFPCTVGLPEMLAPELQVAGDLSKAKFTKSSDYFSLCIHIFRLLMNNADPFGGVITNGASISNIPANAAICNGECVYVRNVPGKRKPDWAPSPSMLPPEIYKLFNKTFNYTAITAMKNISKRAMAAEWCKALYPYATPEPNPRLKHCSVNKNHVYPAHNSTCPWCDAEKNKGSVSNRTRPSSSNNVSNLNVNRNQNNNLNLNYGTVKKKKSHWKTAAVFLVILLMVIGTYKEKKKIENINANENMFFVEENTVNYQKENSDSLTTSTEIPTKVIAESYIEEYVIDGSDSRYITENELNSLTQQQVQLARNEIFARHGRKFNTDWIREYFEQTNWYTPIYEPEEFDQNLIDALFNEFEKENIRIINEYEEKMGYT